MWHETIVDDKLIAELEAEDARIAARVKAQGCPHCGGRLDRADYPRKPRSGGLGAAADGMDRRISLCCAREGCRRRATPPSLVFLGRRVYLGIAVLLASLRATKAASETTTEAAPAVPRRTVGRWLWWFQEVLPRGSFFAGARARLWPPIEDAAALPGALVERVGAGRGVADALRATLRFLAPTTTASVADGARFVMAPG